MRQSSGVSHLQPSTKFQKSSNESFNKGGISERMGGIQMSFQELNQGGLFKTQNGEGSMTEKQSYVYLINAEDTSI